ncbi:hypothetical protein OAR98_00515 [Candidatus Pelagibacter sp.]|nr:hypothetical protein [Candidatus Pelagibacter sp.]
MIEEDLETYLSISKNKFEIFLFDKINLKNLYKEELEIKNIIDFEELNNLTKFLDDNIFRIEKLSKKFIKNIFVIIENSQNLNINISIKKKNYDYSVNSESLKNTLTEIKDLFKENYRDQNIIHMIVNNYLINGKRYFFFEDNIKSDDLCLEVNFISISKNLEQIFDKIFEKYQIKVEQFFDLNYLENQLKDEKLELPEIVQKIRNGYNVNEITLIPKNIKNKGFFENFFQLFS